jgi:hypothetical protein
MPKRNDKKFDTDQRKLLEKIILITGRDLSILDNILYHSEERISLICTVLDNLRIALLKDERFELVNRILLVLGIPRMSKKFFDRVFGNTSFSAMDDIGKLVDRIQFVYLLEHGNFYYGYQKLRDNDPLPIIGKNFSQDSEKEELISQYRRAKNIPAFEDIEIGQRYSLGYLASKENKEINGYRETLVSVLEKGIEQGASNPEALWKVAEKMNINNKDWEKIVIRAAIPHSNDLLWWRTVFAYYSKPDIKKYSSFLIFMQDAKEVCKKLENEQIEKIRESGRKNTYAYLSTSELDIYFATSMRKALDFVTNATFIEEVINILKKESFNLLYFDPTQSFLDDRIQKGLIESIMIKRCKIIVYNAQEQETFGKDAEAGIGLAHQKPVIIYVPRMFCDTEELREFFLILDTVGYEKEPLGKALKDAGYLDEKKYYTFIAPEIEKIEVIKDILIRSAKLNGLFDKITEDNLKGELVAKGYEPADIPNLKVSALDKMLGFETRALLFKDLHPLSFQISPLDGIARGVFVTRTAKETVELIRNLFDQISRI